MDYEGIDNVVCEAEESDWLDVSYSERNFVKPKKEKARKKVRSGRAWKIVTVAVVCVALLAGLLFIDGDFRKDVFEAVKTATAIFNKNPNPAENKIDIPCNLTLVDVNDGVMVFGGGRAALSLTDGTVSEITESSVTVNLDEKTSVTYSQLTDVLVAVGDVVSANSLLGKYDGSFCASILQSGEVVKQVVGSETQLVWNV